MSRYRAIVKAFAALTDEIKSPENCLAMDIKVKAHDAMLRLTEIKATPLNIYTLAAACDLSKALYLLGIGGDYLDLIVAASESIINIVNRSPDKWTFVPAGDELNDLEALLALHAVQLTIATDLDIARGLRFLNNEKTSSLSNLICNMLANSEII